MANLKPRWFYFSETEQTIVGLSNTSIPLKICKKCVKLCSFHRIKLEKFDQFSKHFFLNFGNKIQQFCSLLAEVYLKSVKSNQCLFWAFSWESSHIEKSRLATTTLYLNANFFYFNFKKLFTSLIIVMFTLYAWKCHFSLLKKG